MSQEEMLKKWKEVAEGVMGPDFFSNFFGRQGEFQSNPPNSPRYNLYRNSSEIIVLVELPYVGNISQIKLNVQEKEISIKGHIQLGYDHLEKTVGQIFSGPFDKQISLPEPVNVRKVNAQYKQGLLIIQLFPKLGKKSDKQSVRIQEL